MDQFQNRKNDEQQPDPQLVSTVTMTVLQALQASDALSHINNRQGRQNGEAKTIDLIGLFFAVLEKFWLVAICAVLGTVYMSMTATTGITTYTATAKLYIVDTTGGINFANLQLSSALTMDYQEVFKTWEVHEMVIDELDLPFGYEQMQGMLAVTNPEDTRILYITVTYPDAKMAADIANAYAKAAKTFIINTMHGEEPSDFSIALEPSFGRTVTRAGRLSMGFMLGSVLAVGMITLFYVLDNRPRSPEGIAETAGIPTLSVFPANRRRRKTKGVAHEEETFPGGVFPHLTIENLPERDFITKEATNTLCTNLSYCGPDIRKVMLTSRFPREGKSYISMTLMRMLADLGRRVVLVDTDLRASGIQSDYQMRYSTQMHHGLSEYLSDHCGFEDVLYQTNIKGAYMIPAGHMAPNPLQLLDTEKMEQLIRKLEDMFDIVLIDTPPVGMLSDAVALAKYCDGVLLVVGYRKGSQKEITEVVNTIRQTGCKILGAVLNGVKFKGISNRYYYYKSGRYSHYYGKHYGKKWAKRR